MWHARYAVAQQCRHAALPASSYPCKQHPAGNSQLCSLQERACEAAARTEHLSLWTMVSNLAAHTGQPDTCKCTTTRNERQACRGADCSWCIVLASRSESSSTSSGSSPLSPWPPEPSLWPPPPTGTGKHTVNQTHLHQALAARAISCTSIACTGTTTPYTLVSCCSSG